MPITTFNGENLCNDLFFLCMAASSKLHVIIKHPDSRTVGGQENLWRGFFFFQQWDDYVLSNDLLWCFNNPKRIDLYYKVI